MNQFTIERLKFFFVHRTIDVICIPATGLAEENSLSGFSNVILMGKIIKETGLFGYDEFVNYLVGSIPPAKEALIEAEKERQRALYREKHPEAAYENVSKKKQQQRQKEEAEAAAKAYAKKKAEEAGLVPEEDETEVRSESAVGDRPYARGRAYKADRYQK